MNVTDLQYQAGVQYSQSNLQEDEESIEGLDRYLFAGEFKRGRFDIPFKVTKNTMASILGQDSKNPYYIALEDAFETGAEEIWVMRLESSAIKIVEPPYSAWTINPGVTVQNGTARYTAFKTNIASRYDSFADLDLAAAVTRSLQDADMRLWEAVKNAISELSGVTEWGFDNANNQIIYTKPKANPQRPDLQFVYTYDIDNTNFGLYETAQDACNKKELMLAVPHFEGFMNKGIVFNNDKCTIDPTGLAFTMTASKRLNPYYNPNAVPENLYIQFSSVASKIISSTSSSNQGTALLAEAYLENVAKSISSADTTKQFVKPADLTVILEINKVLT